MVMAVVICFIQMAPGELTTAFVLLSVLSLVALDPYHGIARILAPQTRWILSTCIIVDGIAGYCVYFDGEYQTFGYEFPSVKVITFLGVLTLLLLAMAWKLNAFWQDQYRYLDCPEVTRALVEDEEYRYNRYWERRGRRMAASLLNHHLGRRVSDEDMEHTMRYVFVLGMASADDYSGELVREAEDLKSALAAKETDMQKIEERIEELASRKASEKERVLKSQSESKQKLLSLEREEHRKTKALLKELKDKTDAEIKDLKYQIWQMSGSVELKDGEIKKMEERIQDLISYSGSPEAAAYRELESDAVRMADQIEQLEAQCERDKYLIASQDAEIRDLKSQLDEALYQIDLIQDDDHCHLAPSIVQLPVQQIREEDPEKEAAALSSSAAAPAASGGRPSKLSPEQQAEIIEARSAGVPWSELTARYQVSKSLMQKICRDAKAAGAAV